MVQPKKIPVMRPLLPTAEKILPYLKEIDVNRWYTNFGPLVFRFEEALAQLFGVSTSSLITVANGTAGLTALLQAYNIEPGSLCLMPSWTFIATPASAIAAGLTPYFLDVNEESWALDPAEVKQCLRLVPGKVGAVIVVSPFGSPVQTKEWDAFTAETGIPVIIDAAAAFDTVLNIPECRMGATTSVMLSLHATKTFGIGEGGVLLAKDTQLLHKVRQLTNFGFTASRAIVLPGVNAKLTEYGAAIGFAALEQWPEKRKQWQTLTTHYMNHFAKAASASVSHRLSNDWVGSTCNVRIPPQCSDNVIEQLGYANIEARKWWVKGCHQQKAYAQCPRFALPVTEKLADSVIALPFSVDLKEEEVAYIVKQLTSLF